MPTITSDISPGQQAFDAWLDRFFAHYYAARPVNATFIGVHDHDHALPDYSSSAIARHVAEMEALRRELRDIDVADLDLARRHDAQVADGFLELQIMEAGLTQFHRGNPAAYSGEAVFSIISLFLRDAEPLADRVSAAISRMQAMPAFLAQARENIASAPLAWTETALREARAAEQYFGEGLLRLEVPAEHLIPFRAAAATAQAAMRDFAEWLDTSLRHRTHDDVACGREAFDRYLARGHALSPEQNAAWVKDVAAAALAETRAALVAKAAEIDPARTWQEQLPALADDHPDAAGYYDAFAASWVAAREAALAHDLVTWPDYPIAYVPLPATDREAAQALYYLNYRCPPPYGQPETHRYLPPGLPPDSEPEKQQERLRQVNDTVILLNHVVHHGGLGHHVQNWNAFRASSRLGQMGGVDCASRIAVFAAGTLVEGWACYATDLMDEIGYLSPLQSLSQAQGRMRMAARAVADVALHTGEMTLAETAAFYEREAGMSAAASHGEAVKNSMFPGAAMMYLIGTEAIHTLRRQLTERQGKDFSLRAFHDQFLSYGAIPTALIAEAMLAS